MVSQISKNKQLRYCLFKNLEVVKGWLATRKVRSNEADLIFLVASQGLSVTWKKKLVELISKIYFFIKTINLQYLKKIIFKETLQIKFENNMLKPMVSFSPRSSKLV